MQEQLELESSEPQVYSISDLNKLIKGTLEGQFPLVWLKGEISNFKLHYASGHCYFSLKDNRAQVSAVMFKGHSSRLKFTPKDGMEVIVRGRITVYEPRGSYQIMCELMEPVGVGALQKAFEQLKEKLAAEGLFDSKRKRALPAFPRKVALVTSPTGAAIKDMLNVLTRRFKGLEITLIPTSVQGANAPAEIVAGILQANKAGGETPYFDVMIVGRGGGSIEDLWGFNDEAVARAIAASRIPVVSAVGHEIDFTIADFVADLRAPTPSAAAELVTNNAADIQNNLHKLLNNLKTLIQFQLRKDKELVTQYSKRLVDPKRKLEDMSLRCDELLLRLESSLQHRFERERSKVLHIDTRLKNLGESYLIKKQNRLAQLSSVLDSLSPLKVVDRGYSLATQKGRVLKSTKKIKAGDSFHLRLAEGEIEAQVVKVLN